MLLDIIKKVYPKTSSEEINRFSSLEIKLLHSGINSQERLAGFLSQIGHESGGFSSLEESLYYSEKRINEIFSHRIAPHEVSKYARNPVALGSRVYENRMGNGPESTGEGYKFRGRGLIQLTGKENYQKCGDDIGHDLISNPDYVKTPDGAVDSAIWFWNSKDCNSSADKKDIHELTLKVNGGTNGLAERRMYFDVFLTALNDYNPNGYVKIEGKFYRLTSNSAIIPSLTPVTIQKQPSILEILRKLFTKK